MQRGEKYHDMLPRCVSYSVAHFRHNSNRVRIVRKRLTKSRRTFCNATNYSAPPYSAPPGSDSDPSSLIYSTEQFLERMQNRPFVDMDPSAPNPMVYHLFAPPAHQQLIQRLPIRPDSSNMVALSFAASTSGQPGINVSDIANGAASAYLGLAECINEGDLHPVMEQSGEWASTMVKGWGAQMKTERLGFRLNVSELVSAKVINSEVYIQTSQVVDPRDPDNRHFVHREIDTGANMHVGIWLSPNQAASFDDTVAQLSRRKNFVTRILTFPKRMMQSASVIRTAVRGLMLNVDDQTILPASVSTVAWVGFYVKEKAELYNLDTGKTVFETDENRLKYHVWKFGATVPLADPSRQDGNLRWKIFDFDNQVMTRALLIRRRDKLLPDDKTPYHLQWMDAVGS